LEFFFRNGPLRKRFDGLKYAVKRVDGIVFDLSMVSSPASLLGKRPLCEEQGPSSDSSVVSPTSLPPLSTFDSHPFFCADEMDAVKERLNEYDRQREAVIKKTRDIQKHSKQAIFSLHGKRFSEGREKLLSAKRIADEIRATVSEVRLPLH
jgi:hypothetical protein